MSMDYDEISLFYDQNETSSDLIKEFRDNIFLKEQSQDFSLEFNIRTEISGNEIEESFPPNTNKIKIESSNHDKNSINSQNNDDRRFFTITKEASNRGKLRIVSKKYFNIEKDKKRRKKDDITQKDSSKKHNKFSEDNIVTRVKTCFVNSLVEYINKKYSEYKGKEKLKLLKKISPNFSKAYSKKRNQYYLRLDVKQFVSMEISKRCHNPSDYNKKQIEKLYKQNESKELIDSLLLDERLSDVYEKYIKKGLGEFSLENDLKKLKEKKEENNKYINQYKKKAMQLIEILSRQGKIKNRRFSCKKYKPSKKKKNNNLSDSSDVLKSG